MEINTKSIQSSTKFLQKGSVDTPGFGYKNIPIFAAPHLHEKCFEVFENLHLDKNISILVLGAGAGAFDQRMIDSGYKNITAIEFVKENYIAKNENVFDFDLNDDFDLNLEGKKFDLVIAMEIIEHIYSPFDFLRKIKKLLKEDGKILLTTPNVGSGISRIKFLLAKKIQLFSELDLVGSGHISPIFEHILYYFLQSLGYSVTLKTNNGHEFSFLPLNLKIAYILFFPFIIYRRDSGYINIYLINNRS